MPGYDVSQIRSEFPALQLQVNGNAAAFFDGPGGTQVPQRVLTAIETYLLWKNSNNHGAFKTSFETKITVDGARSAAADFLGCSPREVAFGENATSLLFKLAYALSRSIEADDEVLITTLDHEANRGPWQQILGGAGAQVREVNIDQDTCSLDMADFEAKLNEKTKVVAVTYASNAVGTITDIKKIIDRAHAVNAVAVVDAVHYALHGAIDVKDINADFLVCSGYKVFGPHIGFLYGKADVFNELATFRLVPQKPEIPYKLETGTLNHEGLAGFIEAIAFIASLGARFGGADRKGRRAQIVRGMHAIEEYQRPLLAYLTEELAGIGGVTIYGPTSDMPRTATVSITMAGQRPREVAQKLGTQGIFVWDGHFYATTLIEKLGLKEAGGLIRIGLAPYNTGAEIDRLLQALRTL